LIREHIEALQREFRERFGVEASISINIHSIPGNRKYSEAIDLACKLQPEIGADLREWSGGICLDNLNKNMYLTVYYSE